MLIKNFRMDVRSEQTILVTETICNRMKCKPGKINKREPKIFYVQHPIEAVTPLPNVPLSVGGSVHPSNTKYSCPLR